MDLLLKYDYPGNVRELENIIERAVVIARDPIISIRDLPFKDITSHDPDFHKLTQGSLKDSVEALEQHLIDKALADADNNQSKAAELLGLSERMLRYKLKKYRVKE